MGVIAEGHPAKANPRNRSSIFLTIARRQWAAINFSKRCFRRRAHVDGHRDGWAALSIYLG
jgi:hypothetical protein